MEAAIATGGLAGVSNVLVLAAGVGRWEEGHIELVGKPGGQPGSSAGTGSAHDHRGMRALHRLRQSRAGRQLVVTPLVVEGVSLGGLPEASDDS